MVFIVERHGWFCQSCGGLFFSVAVGCWVVVSAVANAVIVSGDGGFIYLADAVLTAPDAARTNDANDANDAPAFVGHVGLVCV